MKLASIPGITSVSLRSVADTTAELLAAITRIAEHDPTLEAAAVQAAEAAHRDRAGLLAVVTHPAADPGILVGGVITASQAEELRNHLLHASTPELREVTEAKTAKGCSVLIVEPILMAGAQLQAVVTDTAPATRATMFTLHSPTGRGWLDLAGVAGRLLSTLEFTARSP
ncbi:hypothetical protein [Actinocrispum wychmicini]|uniref:Uncharacterized protein n=1 Tax=Actinocrispum wychmicini TaxID=1213861 RepID=A0A4R2JAH4_9PSEU|nr:hypothetical protein [Actinocrispum wychmicini]TCO52959.1 hypothetical protein EV192_111153 [Actinocrispum wychmicini]